MENESKERLLYRQFTSKMKDILSDEDAAKIFDSLSHGQNSYMRVDRVESSSFDLSWINNIESCIPDLGTIVLNPRLSTKTVEDLVPVELARKTNADSVKHLASHTQYIKDITEDGDVIPNKVLNIGSDDEIKTYENKFIATLIRHLVLFVEKRYQFVKNFAVLHDHETLFFKNKSQVGNANVEIETKVKVVSEKLDPVSIQNNKYIARIEEMRQYLLYFYNSKFMKAFKTERNVRSPILQTNILRKNPVYHHCYELYRFIEAYDRLGVAYAVDEKFTQFSDVQLNELNCLMFANYLAVQGKDKELNQVGEVHQYAPRILTSSDDEKFVYGPLLKGPISFVRVDEAYQRYLDNQVDPSIPSDEELKESKELKNYYRQELDVRKLTRKEYEEKVKLLERKKWDKLFYDKDIEAIIEQRKREEEEERRRRVQERLRQEDEYLAKFRQHIVDEALAFQPTYAQDEYEKSFVVEDEDQIYKKGKRSTEPLFNPEMSANALDDLEKELRMQELKLAHNDQKSFEDLSSSIEREKDFEEKIKQAHEAQIRAALEAKIRKELKESIYEELKRQAYEEIKASLENIDKDALAELDKKYARPELDQNAQEALPVSTSKGLEQEIESDEGDEVLRDSSSQRSVKPYLEGKVREIPVPLPMDFDDPRRLTPEEQRAMLTYNLLEESLAENMLGVQTDKETSRLRTTNHQETMHSGIFGNPKANEDPFVPFNRIDEDYLDPFERIRALNHAYQLYDREFGPFIQYPDVLKDALIDNLDTNLSQEEALEEIKSSTEETKEDSENQNEYENLTQGLIDGSYKVEEKELYVVYCKEGYVTKDGFSADSDEAYVFTDRASATMKALMVHGKLINLL